MWLRYPNSAITLIEQSVYPSKILYLNFLWSIQSKSYKATSGTAKNNDIDVIEIQAANYFLTTNFDCS